MKVKKVFRCVHYPPASCALFKSRIHPQGGITHIFVVEFACAADRDYYVNSDPAHKKFVELVSSLMNTEATRVLDFKPLLFKEK